MTQSFTRRCPRCATPAPSEQLYCQRCGGSLEAVASTPTVRSREFAPPQTAPASPTFYNAPTQVATPPVGVPRISGQGEPKQPATAYSPTLPAAALLPQQQQVGRRLKRGIWGLGIAALILVLVLGTAGYFLLHLLGSRSANAGGSTPDATPTQSSIITTSLNETITYSSVIITLVSAQQASRFADDASTSSVGALRLNIHENQAAPLDTGGGTTDPYYGYGKPFNLVLPGGKVIAPDSSKIVSGPTGKASQDNWLDFSVPTEVKVNQLTLRIGDTNQAQMDVPLTANADLSAYQPKVVQLTTRVPYGNTFWTLTTASKQWSDGGQQAGKGQRFIVLALTVENPSSSDVNAFPPDYLRLQVGGNQVAEANDNLPTGFAAGTTSSKGLVAFLVPQESTSFSLVLLGNGTAGASSQATIPFTIP